MSAAGKSASSRPSGAPDRIVGLQFVLEALVLVALGGVVGAAVASFASGGIATALISSNTAATAGATKLILADGPTGNLDEQTGEHIIALVSSLSRDHNTTILVVTHDRSLANKTERRFRFQQGRLTEETARARTTAGSPA